MKKIWMSSQTKKKKHSASLGLWKTLLVVILLLLMFLFLEFFLLTQGLFTPVVSGVMTLLAGIVLIGYAVRSGSRNYPHVYVFFLTEEHELFYVDARSHQKAYMDGVLGAMEIYAKADKILEEIKSTGELPKSARKILWVKNIRERSRDVSIVCRTQTQQGYALNETLFVSYDLPDVQSLLLEFEARKRATGPNAQMDKNLFPMFISCIFLIGFALLCFFSHPYQAYLPDRFYYPSMALTVIALCFFLYYFLKHHRGEN